ncbi:E3 ubiquitin protein ligase RIE1-like [Bidens hawaiensis]|uniref:E3 ubiquitin protein ligase RIE1-like n=1 Tax=Bidens hawaiensis TaxID=980011 RepID=UPI0040499EBB
MTEIATPVPEITEITAVGEPLLSQPQLTVPPNTTLNSPIIHILLALFARRRGASIIVRQNVAMQLEDWREEFGYSFPVVVVETLWNLAFVVLSIVTLFWYAWEERCVRLRVWICGYVVHCVANVVILLMEYKKRRMRVELVLSLVSSSSSSENHGYHQVTPIRWETINKVFSYVWWPIGFIWMLYSYSSPGNAQLLLWLAMDVFFFVVTFLSLSLVGMACCLCLPCVIGFLCYIGSEGSASEAAIKILPEYRFEMSNDDADQPDERACRMIPMGPNGPDLSTVRFLQTEDARGYMELWIKRLSRALKQHIRF